MNDGAQQTASLADNGREALGRMDETMRRVSDAAGGTRLTTETRVFAPDRSVRRRFALYWTAIRPGSGMIRRMWLRAVKRRAVR